MYLLGLFIPLVSSINLLLFGKIIGRKKSIYISCIGLFVSWILSLLYLFEVVYSKEPCRIILREWFTTTVSKVYWIFLFDFLSTIMFFVITTISFLVHLFSAYYLKEDPHVIRFFSFLSIFTFFMLFLVTAGSFVQLIIGWEGVGLSSFLLINFWYTRIEANKAALKAVLINRIGDCALIIGMGIIYNLLGTFDFLIIKYCIHLCF